MTTASRILLFTGDGKGKTTAALGIVLRALGHGMRAAVHQFVKNDADTGEMRFVKHGFTRGFPAQKGVEF